MSDSAVRNPESDVESARRLGEARRKIEHEVEKVIVGQKVVVEQVLTCLLAHGHGLLIGVPGLAKTLLVNTLAQVLDLSFKRVQFTPDLMPSDITGTEIIEEDQASHQRTFRFVKGPVFANVVLADGDQPHTAQDPGRAIAGNAGVPCNGLGPDL